MDLRDAAAWKNLGAYVLWAVIVQVGRSVGAGLLVLHCLRTYELIHEPGPSPARAASPPLLQPQLGILLYTWLFNSRDLGDAGLLNSLLTANNTVIVGLPVMQVGGRS